MLNEIIEAKAYLEDPRSDTPRLKPTLLTQSFKKAKSDENNEGGYHLDGLSHILEIIAREFIFSTESEYDGKSLINEELIAAAVEVLNIWCGFAGHGTQIRYKPVKEWLERHPDAEGWLRQYWIYQYCLKKKKDEAEGLKEWKICAEKWKAGYNDPKKDYSAETVTFNNVIANALTKGRLKERYFVIGKTDRTKRIERVSDLLENGCLFEFNNEYEKTRLKMLKNVIAFLIWQDEHPGKQREVLLKKIRLFGWYERDDDGKQDNWVLDKITFNGRRIMHHRNYGGRMVKFGIDRDFLEYFGAQIIEPVEADKYSEGYWVIYETESGLQILNT